MDLANVNNDIKSLLQIDLRTKKGKTILYTAIQVIGMLFVCLISGCFDFLNFEFTLSRVTTQEYWQQVIRQTILYSIALGLGYMGKLEREELNNTEYFQSLKLYRELLKCKKESFVRYIEDIFNPNIKKEYIRKNTFRKLHKLDRRSKDEWKVYYKKAIESGNPLEYEYPDKKIKDYCLRRIQLEELISEKYIDENINFISVKYPRINPNCFTENIRMIDGNASKYKVENTTGRDVPFAMARKMVSTLLIATIIGLIITDPSLKDLLEDTKGLIAVIIKYIITLLMIFWSFFQGTIAAKNMFYNNFILVANNRSSILKSYINWANENNEQDTYIDKFMDAYYNQYRLKEELEETIKKAEKLT